MSNCLLSIGGSGHRALKPLVFLAAAGALGDAELSLLCVDNDGTNGNLTESLNLIHLYDKVRGKQKWMGDSPFFRPKLRLADERPWSPFSAREGDPTLDHYLGHESMRANAEELTALYEFLYDREKRSLSVAEGFRGRPSIGAAVYRAAARGGTNGHPDALQRLREQLEAGTAQGRSVKLFSIGSIFGGTGAAGLPSIPVSLIDSMKHGSEHVLSGGAFLLPYFEFNPSALDDQGPHANPNDFIMMMKDALRYYLLNPSRYQCIYAIGADKWRHLENAAVGKEKQRNQSDLVEFLAALAASNFLVTWQPPDSGENGHGPALYVLHREKEGEFNWSDVPEQERIKPKLAAFTRFCFLYVNDFYPELAKAAHQRIGATWFTRHVQHAGVNPATAEFQEQASSMRDFCREFLRWLVDLHHGGGMALNLVHANAFAQYPFVDEAFPTLIVGDRYRSTAKQVVQQVAGLPLEHRPDLSGFGHFVHALAAVTA
jgi:hypothetical protein